MIKDEIRIFLARSKLRLEVLKKLGEKGRGIKVREEEERVKKIRGKHYVE